MTPSKLKKFLFASKGIISLILEEENITSYPLHLLDSGQIPLVGIPRVKEFIADCVLQVELLLLAKYEEDLLNPQFKKQLNRLLRISESLKSGHIPKYK